MMNFGVVVFVLVIAVAKATTPSFPSASVWYQDISSATLDSQSTAIIQWFNQSGGFGGGRFQVDFSFHILKSNSKTKRVDFKPLSGYYTPDCDIVQTIPLPDGGAIEGQSGYTCDYENNDCHLIVHDTDANLLYESYQSTWTGSAISSQCLALWNLSRVYPSELRGEQCTSSDAAGFPIATLLFTADEVAAGSIDHAIRFILPNNRMRKGYYTRPGTHAGAPSANASYPTPVYGGRWRLKSSFDESKLSSSAQVVARALKKYGMVLADGGNIALTAQDDTYTTAKWSNLGFNSLSLTAIKPTDFEIIDTGSPIKLTYDCVRTPENYTYIGLSTSTTTTTDSSSSEATQVMICFFALFVLALMLV